MAYQDAWIRGFTVAKGDRVCAKRYDVIRSFVQAYQRPVTVFDLGANMGYFGCRLADEFGATAIMAESRPQIVDICEQNQLPTTIVLQRRMSVTDLNALADCEHFDIVLALNVLHHFRDCQRALSAVLRMGELALIETPTAEDTGAAHVDRASLIDTILSGRASEVTRFPGHTTPGVDRVLYGHRSMKSSLADKFMHTWKVGARPVRPHTITSSFTEKTITFNDGESRPWVPGMNLWNWCALGGGYPFMPVAQRAVREAVERAPHPDLRPWNFVLGGNTVTPIDLQHHERPQHTLDMLLAQMEDPTLAFKC